MEARTRRRPRPAGSFCRSGRRGYGLPALATVLLLSSIFVQTLVDAMARETTEARADAAFNVARAHLDRLRVTGRPTLAGDAPHLAGGTRHLRLERLGGADDPRLRLAFVGGDPRARALFEQKLRAYLVIPAADAIGEIRPEDVRRPRPERTLRSGDRMAAALEARDILGADGIRAGVARAGEVRAGVVRGVSSTLILTPRMSAGGLVAERVEVAGELVARDVELSSSLATSGIAAARLGVGGDVSASDATFGSVVQSGRFAASDGLVGAAGLEFGILMVSGLRAAEIRAGAFRANSVHGAMPERGRIETGG